MSRRITIMLLLGLAGLVASCGIDKADIGVETPPLLLRREGTFPADSTRFTHDAQGLNIVASFNRAIEPGEVSLVQIVPQPAVAGTVFNPNSNVRQILINGVVLDPMHRVYRLLLDGPTMPEPRVLSYFSGDQSVRNPAIRGHVSISRGSTSPSGALVYALVPPGVEERYTLSGTEERFLGLLVLGCTTTLEVSTEPGGWYQVAGLQEWRSYMVAAILDTNGDGLYELDADWWGYYHNELGNAQAVTAGVALGGWLDPPLPELSTDVDIVLRPPGSLEPFDVGRFSDARPGAGSPN
ncbi:hypothetical protein DRQ53_10240 [bacterium]|nr:MAG: hypothetical protein DRQ53_10240 [bacterium]